MIQEAFRLEGKVAIVTGCDTGLGQGMAVALAEAGCDVVGVNRKIPHETSEKINALGRRFMAIQADLSQQDALTSIVTKTVSAFGRVDILVNNAGTIRRQDALDFSEKDWDDVMNLNLKSVFFLSQAVARQFLAQGNGGKIINIASMLSFRAVSVYLPIPHQKAVFWASPACSPMNGRPRELMSTPSRPAIWRPTTPSNCARTASAIRRLSIVFPQDAGARQMT